MQFDSPDYEAESETTKKFNPFMFAISVLALAYLTGVFATVVVKVLS